MRSFDIGKRRVGEGAPVLFIAELSANHCQKKDIAFRTVEAAAKAGADAIKLQTYTPDTMTLDCSAPHFVVKTNNVWAGRTLYDLYREAMTPWEWHAELKAAAEAAGLLCFSTPFDPTAVEFLESLDVPAHKIASFELTDLPLVEKVARTGRPLIISTGMATLGEVEAVMAICREVGNDKVALLRCVSSYPAQPDQMALSSLGVLASFGTVIGLSDHTRDATAAIASVALGAKIIEKHFILERSMGGPDAFFSMEPDEFRAMVDAVRNTEKALGKPSFGPTDDERASVVFRRSLFIAKDVAAGEILTCDHVRSVRPSVGLAPRHLPELLGRCAAINAAKGTPLAWDMVGPRPQLPGSRRIVLSNEIEAPAESLARFIVTHEGRKVGTATLERSGPAQCSVAFELEPSALPCAVSVLGSIETKALEQGVLYLTASICPDDDARLRAFKEAGYYAFARRGAAVYCERRIAPYGRL